MISVSEAKNILVKNIPTLSVEYLKVSDSLGRVISKDLTSPIDVPSFNNSSMDGYAFCFEDKKTQYKIVGSIQAGDTNSLTINAGESARIFTGAPIPKGADTVIQQELVTINNDEISIDNNEIQIGSNIRLRGSQCKKGDIVIKSGTLVTVGVVALLSSVGITKIPVYRQPRVKVIITGNELIEPGTPLCDGKIYNANQSSILSYLKLLGIENTEFIHVKDNLDELRSQVSVALNNCDVLILSGGISVGEYDFVYKALIEESVQPLFYKVKQKPGKPMFVGKKDDKLIFALPGNPAAVITCFNQYVKPSLRMMLGESNAFNNYVLLPLAKDWKKNGVLSNILKAEVKNGEVTILHGEDSFNLLPFVDTNTFVLLYENDMEKKKGELVELYYW